MSEPQNPTPMAMDFEEAEYATRVDALQAAMHDQNLDAVLLTTEAEVRYFSGFRTLFWQSPTRPWFLIVPATGKPIAIIPEIGADLMRATWLEDVRTFSSPHATDDGLSLLVAELRTKNRIGMPMGRESLLRMPMNDFSRLRRQLPVSELVDISPTIQKLRQIKSEAEIDKIREICQIASSAFENAPNLFYEGQTLKEAFRAFRVDLMMRGADDVPYLVGGAGPGGYGDVISPPSRQQLQKGDIFMLDTGATLDGYFCDFDRNFAIGEASEEACEAYRTLYRATEAALAAARPGVTCAQLFRVMAEEIGTVGSNVGRFGHGLGMQLTEGVSLIDFDMTELAPGMVLTLEPSIAIGPGTMMVHEENIVIRDGAPELLTRRAAPELPVLTPSQTALSLEGSI